MECYDLPRETVGYKPNTGVTLYAIHGKPQAECEGPDGGDTNELHALGILGKKTSCESNCGGYERSLENESLVGSQFLSQVLVLEIMRLGTNRLGYIWYVSLPSV